MAQETTQLTIAPDLEMPLSAVTRTFGILGQRGSGKTSSAVVMAEEMAPHAQFVVIDPTGAWYGLRTSASGKSAGLDVVVLGGFNGDAPLEPEAGELVASLVVDEGYSLVLDLEEMRKGQQVRFVSQFLESLYHRNRRPLHLFVDEAQRFAPQNPRGKGGDAENYLMRSIGAMEDAVKLGRRKGLGVTLISQRPAGLNKEVLEQTETLIVHRVTGPRDRAAIKEWFEANSDLEMGKVVSALSSLKTGEAFVSSPSFLGAFQRTKVRKKKTYDSSSTPEVGGELVAPPGRSKVDLAALRDRMADVIERQKSDDPKELRERVKTAEAALASARANADDWAERVEQLESELAERPPETVEVEVLDNDAFDAVLSDMTPAVDDLAKAISKADELWPLVEAFREAVDDARKLAQSKLAPPPPPPPVRSGPARVVEVKERPPMTIDTVETRAAEDNGGLSAPDKRILAALVWYESVGIDHPSRVQVGLASGYKAAGGRFSNLLGALRTRGYIDYPAGGAVTLTDLGHSVAPPEDVMIRTPESNADFQRGILEKVDPSQAKLLRALIARYPLGYTRAGLAEATGYDAGGGRFSNLLGSLRTLGLVEYPQTGEVVARDILFPLR